MARGFIYFITNPAMPSLVKIGMTTRHPLDRMDELSSATACPQPFKMLALFDTPIPAEAERAIHASLEEYRVNQSREFFMAPWTLLQDKARQWCDPNDGICNLEALDRLVEQDQAAETATFALMKARM
jgi:hypothetical protein